ncbi:MAG: T9SS type A sorting domain-containing protein [Taibaiella sp.]|jgi:hypothetical protein
MIRKFLCLSLVLGLSAIVGNAQDFTLSKDTLQNLNVVGQSPPTGSTWDSYAYKLFNYVHNETNAPLTFNWQIYNKTLPFGWFIYGFCDNLNCRTQSDPSIASGTVASSSPIPVNDSSQLEPWVAVPADAEFGIGIIKVRVTTTNTTDTAIYILKRNNTGISTISVGDSRVYLSPNPASNNLQVFADQSLHASHINIYDITGKHISLTKVQPAKEIVDVDISNLASGLYMLRLTDDNGKMITTRKFAKK